MRPLTHYATHGPLYFYGGPFSSFAVRPTLIAPAYAGTDLRARSRATYQCRERYYQGAKAMSRSEHDWVIAPTDTWEAKARGQVVKLRPDWEEVKYEIMVEGIRAECEQHEDFAQLLRLTGDRQIAEDSPTDFIWGIRDERGGMTGENLLGKALMEVRAEIL